MSQPLQFDNSYLQLPARFYTRLAPTPVSRPGPIRVNRKLAQQLGIDADWLASGEGTEALAGNRLPEGAEPIATVYAGHQFGGWAPQLGDGRWLARSDRCGWLQGRGWALPAVCGSDLPLGLAHVDGPQDQGIGGADPGDGRQPGADR